MHDRQRLKHEASGGGDFNIAAVLREFAMNAHQHADAVAGDVVEVGAVHDDFVDAGIHQRFKLPDKRIGGVGVESAVGAKDQHAAIKLVIVELHAQPIIHGNTPGAKLRE